MVLSAPVRRALTPHVLAHANVPPSRRRRMVEVWAKSMAVQAMAGRHARAPGRPQGDAVGGKLWLVVRGW
jgi:hypothetical protein